MQLMQGGSSAVVCKVLPPCRLRYRFLAPLRYQGTEGTPSRGPALWATEPLKPEAGCKDLRPAESYDHHTVSRIHTPPS